MTSEFRLFMPILNGAIIVESRKKLILEVSAGKLLVNRFRVFKGRESKIGLNDPL
jgi:hypothetical protein